MPIFLLHRNGGSVVEGWWDERRGVCDPEENQRNGVQTNLDISIGCAVRGEELGNTGVYVRRFLDFSAEECLFDNRVDPTCNQRV